MILRVQAVFAVPDTVKESIESAGEGRLHTRVAILVAVAATFMALCNVKDGNICQASGGAGAEHGSGRSTSRVEEVPEARAIGALPEQCVRISGSV